jgi:predicted DNA-binding transcriptional regulator YafY
MQQLVVLPRTFTRPPDFTLEQRDGYAERRMLVRALFDPSIADWVRESPSYFAVGEELRDDGLLITLRVRHEREVLQWLLGWGSQVRVLEPESLRALLAQEAAAVLEHHTRPGGPRTKDQGRTSEG